MEKVILHCDLNNFFASVALLDNPTLKGFPVAVCGSLEDRHGIVLAKNEQAKKFGIKTAEPIWAAKRKCPDVLIVPPNYARYVEMSQRVREIYNRYTDMVEPFGIDECWLDVTGSAMLFGTGEEIANEIRETVKRETGLTISVGVSFNKVFAKLGSDLKKPDAVSVISKENFRDVVWKLPADVLLGVGKSTKAQLDSLGIFTVGDIVDAGKTVLKNRLGKMGEMLYSFANGEDSSTVSVEEETPKSVSRSTTPSYDLTEKDEVWNTVLRLSENVSFNLHSNGMFCSGVQAHIRFADLSVKEFQQTLSVPTQNALTIAEKCMALIEENVGFSLPFRSVGVKAYNLSGEKTAYQSDIFTDFDKIEANDELDEKLYEIKKKFGKGSIYRAAAQKKEQS